jgi:cytochrome c-type biogenesis protein CcmF
MIPELGQLALIVALLLALVNGVLPVVGAARGLHGWMKSAWPLARAQFVFLAIAFGCLAASVVGNDFSVAYVVSNSNSTLPPAYRFAAAWGGHEGALLLWSLLLTLWMAAVSFSGKELPVPMIARVLGVMSWIDAGFLLLLLFRSNPFGRLLPPAMDGHGLNPLLRDPGMVSYPPVLYLGYAGFAVAFSFAMAALLSRESGGMWARWSRPWTIAAWIFLTLGVIVDCGWTDWQLGWGGWWFWDPVENASFAPWLAGTALMHSQGFTGKCPSSANRTMLLAVCAFLFSLLGTFLVCLSVVASIGALATRPTHGVFMLVFLSIVVGGAAVSLAWPCIGEARP